MPHEINDLGQPVGLPVRDWKASAFPAREPMEGRFCRLVPLEPAEHAAALYAANALDAGGRMWTYLPYGPFDSRNDYAAWLEEMCGKSDPLFFAIVDKPTARAVGVASYLRIEPQAGSIEVGHLGYSPLLQRTPAATEAMFLMMEKAFGLGYRRYEWKCNALNGPSWTAAQRLGFSFEGVFRQANVVKGRNRDTAWFSIMDHEWPALKETFLRWLHPKNFDEQGRQRVRLSTLMASNRVAPDEISTRTTSQ